MIISLTLTTLGEFVWPHQIPVRAGEGRAVHVPLFSDVIFKSKTPTMTYRAPNEDCDVVYPSKHDKGMDLREQQLSDAKKGKAEILSIKTTHVAAKYIDERGLKGYRVGALLQHVKGNAKKSKKGDAEHMPDWRHVSGRFGVHLTVIVRELFVRKADIDEEMNRFDVTWTQLKSNSHDNETWVTEDVIAYFDAVMIEKSSMEAGSKTTNFFTIPKDIRDMIKQKIETWENPQVENRQPKGSGNVEDVQGNYVGTAEFYDKYDAKKMSGNNLVGEIIMFAYCDENCIVTWYSGKVFHANTIDGSRMYSTSFDDDNEDVELKEDDYGPNYADNKSWFVVKSVNFRIGDMVSIIEKVLSEEQKATEKASDTMVVGEKRRRRQTNSSIQLDARDGVTKNKQAGLLKDQVDDELDSDDDAPLFKKKNPVSTKAKKTIEATCFERNVAYNDATYYGVVVNVEHTAKACTLRVVYATMIPHSTNITLKETQILKGKAETVVITKTKASLLSKSNPVAGTDEERRHYMSDKAKYPKKFIEWLNQDTEDRARTALEPSATSAVVAGSCCCGCDNDVSMSVHFCIKTKRRIMAFCKEGGAEGYGSTGICRRCVSYTEPKDVVGRITGWRGGERM
jgi:hypothetical protein